MALFKSLRDIKHNKLLSGVNDAVITSVFDPKEIREAREGELLYKTGDTSNSIYLILKGEVKLKFPSHSYVSTKIHNDFFGEKEMVEETKRVSSAMAFSRLIYYKIDKATLGKLLKKNSSIEDNLKKFGEFKLPETSVETEKKINITERDRPVSFRVFSNGNKLEEDKSGEKETPPVLTQQILPDLESIENSLEEEEDIILNEDNIELEKALEKLQEMNVEPFEDDLEEVIEENEENEPADEVNSELPEEPKEKIIPSLKIEEQKNQLNIENGINREIVRRILHSLNVIYSGISTTELVKNTKRALKDLTNCESADIVFVDEKLSKMFKVTTKGGKSKNEYFELGEGLTGFCASQKSTINYERPTEDDRFNPKIDHPGSSGLKRILYFPIISDVGETVAVLQTARDNNKFAEDDIWCLTMISKQMETAISKTKTLEEILSSEKLNLGKKLTEIITKEIHIPIDIVDGYVKILHSKNLPAEADDLIRMIQKQTASVIEVTDSILKALVDEIVLADSKVHFNEFIDDVLELLSEYCESNDVKLFKKIGDGAVVDIDRSKLYTAILQFIKSSVSDSRTGDRIYFSSELIGESISVNIQNEGKGVIVFPEGDLLDYFYSNDKIKEDEVYILLAKKIVAAHSGQVEVESVKGVGSTIKITLPVAQ